MLYNDLSLLDSSNLQRRLEACGDVMFDSLGSEQMDCNNSDDGVAMNPMHPSVAVPALEKHQEVGEQVNVHLLHSHIKSLEAQLEELQRELQRSTARRKMFGCC